MRKLKSIKDLKKFETKAAPIFTAGGQGTNNVCMYFEDTCNENCYDQTYVTTVDGKEATRGTLETITDC